VTGPRAAERAVPATLPELLRRRAAEIGARTAARFLADGEAESSAVSYSGLELWARAVGALLQEAAGRPGDRVLLVYPPGLEFLGAFLGVLHSGMCAVVVHPPHPARRGQFLVRTEGIIRDAGPTIVLVAPGLRSALAGLSDEQHRRVLTWSAADDVTSLAAAWHDPASRPGDLAFLQYTSGSTSEPKGVMVTHGNLIGNLRMIHDRFMPADQDGSSVAWLPPYHDMGLVGGMLAPLYFASPVTLMPPLAFVQRPRRWLQAISSTRARISGGPSFAYELCVRKVTPEQRDRLDLRSWEVAFNGAEPVDPRTLEAFAEYFAPAGFDARAFKPCYGLAESTLLVSAVSHAGTPSACAFVKEDLAKGIATPCIAGAAHGRTLVSCGTPVLTVAIIDPDRLAECGTGQIGEIWVAGPSVAGGYWNRPAETRETFQARVAGTGGGPFLRTGDLGFVREGELFVTGRLKDLIIIDGQNHYPQDLERTVSLVLPSLGLGECAAFSVERDGGEELVVVIGLGGRSSLEPDEVRRQVRAAVTEHHDLRVADIVVVKAGRIPRTASGKVRRRSCKAMYLDGTLTAAEDR
jgi:acyl-CoA synthetase (AMP-forming)/AMP-acid ligase II